MTCMLYYISAKIANTCAKLAGPALLVVEQ